MVAAPAWTRPGYREALAASFSEVFWLEPALGRLDPGPEEIAEAIEAGAKAVLCAPVAGDCSALPAIEELCARRGVVFALDGRASVGSRVGELGPERFADLVLLPADGEPVPSLLSAAVLFGHRDRLDRAGRPRTTLRMSIPAALRLVADTLRYEPRLRLLWSGPSEQSPAPGLAQGRVPRWYFAAAQARLFQSNERWAQRARHVRDLHLHSSHLPGSSSIEDPAGSLAAGASFPLRVTDARLVRRKLAELGVHCVPGLADWVAPQGARGPRARQLADGVLFLPLHPFYRPDDMGFLTEALRRAVLRSGGGAPDSLAPALEPLPSLDGKLAPAVSEHPKLRVVSGGAA